MGQAALAEAAACNHPVIELLCVSAVTVTSQPVRRRPDTQAPRWCPPPHSSWRASQETGFLERQNCWLSRFILRSRAYSATQMLSPLTEASHRPSLIEASVGGHIFFRTATKNADTVNWGKESIREQLQTAGHAESTEEKRIFVRANAGSRHRRTNAGTAEWGHLDDL